MEIAPEIKTLIVDAVTQAGESFFITDAGGVILYVNPAFETLSGYSGAEVTGKKPDFLKSGVHPKEFYAEMWETIKAGRRWEGRLVNRRKDGTLYNEEIRITPIKDRGGAVKYFLTLRHDITREVALENQLYQSQKMESLGLLAGQMAHDFNNLLTIVIGSMELVAEDLKPGSVSFTLTTEILRSSKESANLIKQLMMFTRRSESKPEAVVINEPVRELKELMDGLLGKSISAVYSLAGDLQPAKVDPAQFKQAVMNLVINAKDAMAGSGAISIATRNAGPENLPPSLTAARYAVFEISDTGPGIPAAALPRIFEPFFTTKPKGKGTGLGLSTVYGVVLQAHGQVFASNRPGGGAVFTIYLPAT